MTKARDIANLMSTLGGTDLDTDAGEVVPHIKLDVLYPAVAGKLLDGSTSHSGDYGTEQSDGRKYYYTDIQGSKPIKDPRIGAYFGSQRHMFKSLQLLEQETATQGSNVYSIDGREWIRAYTTSAKNFVMENGSHGEVLLGTDDCAGVTLEIVGFFNNFNMISRTATNQCDDIGVTVNGGTERDSADTGKLFGDASVVSPLGSRYVSSGSVINHGDSNLTTDLGTTPKINTLKITAKTGSSEYVYTYGIELIAQDTTSTANKSKIQIPAQTVISYGKKHSISATAQHYDPFNGFTSGNLAAVQALIDTDTSLGIANWLHSSTYYRPYNGGRVVKWVDSSGTIKTSVNMMPPNARSIGNSASLTNATAKANASIANNTFYPTMEAGAIDHSQAEVAQAFHWREFGNGAANTGGGGNYADASMLTGTADDIAYVMDDGLTGLSAKNWRGSSTHKALMGPTSGTNNSVYITFIGTGISWKAKSVTHGGVDEYRWFVDGIEVKVYDGSGTTSEFETPAQNLPYGTHIVEVRAVAASDTADQAIKELTFYQPKMPPIPESACIVSDFMLMSDFVSIPNNTAIDQTKISKGVRRISGSRDVHYNGSAFVYTSAPHLATETNAHGFRIYSDSNNKSVTLPYFGNSIVCNAGVSTNRSTANQFKINGTLVTTSSSGTNHSGTQVLSSWTTGAGSFATDNDGSFTMDHASTDQNGFASVSGIITGLNTVNISDTTTDYLMFNGFDIATPIRTSYSYQFFEGQFTKDLIGGDRNMEQTNLVVSPSGKTWDEVTRDTSYLGNMRFLSNQSTAINSTTQESIGDEFRGRLDNVHLMSKDFAIAYDEAVCLKDGEYEIQMSTHMDAGGGGAHYNKLRHNGNTVRESYYENSGNGFVTAFMCIALKRGDTVGRRGSVSTNSTSTYQIKRVG